MNRGRLVNKAIRAPGGAGEGKLFKGVPVRDSWWTLLEKLLCLQKFKFFPKRWKLLFRWPRCSLCLPAVGWCGTLKWDKRIFRQPAMSSFSFTHSGMFSAKKFTSSFKTRVTRPI